MARLSAEERQNQFSLSTQARDVSDNQTFPLL
jgi:hypothetical protein